MRTPSPPLATTSSCYLPGAGPFPDRLPPGMSVEDGLAKGIVGSLDTDDISRVVRTNEGTVKACYERALEGKPTLAGRVTIQFVIAGDGSVEASRLDSSTIGSPSTEACIVETACAWRFPKTQGGGPVTVTYPFTLAPAPDRT
jgi:TonB family protein